MMAYNIIIMILLLLLLFVKQKLDQSRKQANQENWPIFSIYAKHILKALYHAQNTTSRMLIFIKKINIQI